MKIAEGPGAAHGIIKNREKNGFLKKNNFDLKINWNLKNKEYEINEY